MKGLNKMDKKVRQIRIQNVNHVSNIDKITINSLHDDCLMYILDYLEIKERLNLQAVNKRWNRLAKLSLGLTIFHVERIVKCTLEFLDNETKTKKTDFVINFLKHNGSYIQKLSICSFIFEDFNCISLLENFTKYCKNLTYLSVSDSNNKFTDENLKLLFSNNVNLKNIKLSSLSVNGECLLSLCADQINELDLDCCFFKSKGFFFGFMSKLKNLNKLKLNYDDGEFIVSVIDALIMSKYQDLYEFSLNILKEPPLFSQFSSKTFKEFSNDNLLLFLSQQKRLRKLSLCGVLIDSKLIESLPRDSLEILLNLNIKKSYPQNNPSHSFYLLKNLKVLNCSFEELSDNYLIGITTCVSFNLKKLKIRFKEYSISEELIDKFKILQSNYSLSNESQSKFRILQNLEFLHIQSTDCSLNNDAAVKYTYIDTLLKYFLECSNLKHLTILDCNLKTSDYDFVSFFPKLETLKISDTVLSNSDFTYFVKNSLNLKKIKMSYCNNVNEKLIKEISDIKTNRGDNHILEISFNNKCKNFDENKYVNLTPLVKVIILYGPICYDF